MSKKDEKGSKHSKVPKHSAADLPGTRAELLPLHEAARRKRNDAKLGSEAWTEASLEVVRIEVEIARLERAMDPPAG
jgi:hypothetical protein